jgi:hypothetical protein
MGSNGFMTAPLLLDPARADVRVEFGIARAEVAQAAANRALAEQWAASHDVLDEARLDPSLFVDPQFELSPAQRIDYAVRAAAADLAVRLSLSETTVRSQAADAATLRGRLPRLWARFREGEVSPANARSAADLARSLPDDPALASAFDAAVSEIAGQAPARFRARARVLRERIHSVALAERSRAAAETRGVWLDADIDGMAFLSMKLPVDIAHQAFARVDAAARALAGDDETRTLAQLRGDIAGELLMHGRLAGDDALPGVRVAVAVTVPVMTLLGTSDEPGTIEGHGPIDADTARRLAVHAPSFTRLLTHPVSGALLDIDRTTYRVPADLKRWLELTDVTCRFPGCGRLARTSDLDHTVDYQHGGATRAGNLAHLCRHHHRLKHVTRWRARPAPELPQSRVSWTSPTGHERAADPPPF